MRLSDIVRRGAVPPEKGSRVSERISDQVRKGVESAPPALESRPPAVVQAERPESAFREASSHPDVLSEKEVGGEGQAHKDLGDAQQVLQRAADILQEVHQAARAHAPVSLPQAEEAVEILLQSLKGSDALLAPFFSGQGPPPDHSLKAVNVCILSMKIGIELSYAHEELRKLGLAALLSNIGITQAPAQIMGKQGALAPDERAVVERYQLGSAKLLRQLGPEYAWLAEVVEKRYAETKGGHHPENKMEEYATVISLADVFENLSDPRPLRPRLGCLEALKEILRRERTSVPDRMLKGLIRALSTFPMGTLVRLSSGDVGRVVAKNKDFPLRPVLEILARRGKRLEEPVVIDLRQSPLHHIEDSVGAEALP